ncbi:MAG TPA: zf-HC2 domain-containing protein [Candidatus Angelobacter sp.]|nr:zf-HC2 domain-containing protein [Candidatus Angelobacter sp.]
MNHPAREEWMSYLYDELNSEEHTGLAAHLAVCPDCKGKVAEWRAARRDLDAWRVTAKRPRAVPARPLIKWAAAAAIVLATGVGIGRLTSATPDVRRVRAAIEPEIRQQLRQELAQLLREELGKRAPAMLAASDEQNRQLLAEFARAVETKRTEDSQAIYAALSRLESRRVADYVSLKKDLDTVAVLTDAGLRQTQQQLVQLADYSEPADPSNSPKN